MYVALYNSLLPTYTLFAIDRSNRKLLWSAEVWGKSRVSANGGPVSETGSDWHVVSLRATDRTVAVFGCSGTAIYLEAFDCKTGENKCRFSTNYFAMTVPPK
jgi:hypothetical protein